MHPRNPYKTPPDFKAMAIAFPEFRKFVKQDITGKVKLDFSDPAALACLASTLFKKDFGLVVEVPPTGLIPTLPSRLNYLLWVEDLLSTLPKQINESADKKIRGLDIGTGATAVYPLLASKHLGWSMVGTEASLESLATAKANVARNDLDGKVRVEGAIEGELLEAVVMRESEQKFHFTMCNPPFYKPGEKAPEEVVGKPKEVEVAGGEVAFAKKMVDESRALLDKVTIYTVLLGHKSSVAEVKKVLHTTSEVTSLASTQFCQGKTMRWGVAWTFVPGIDLRSVQSVKAKKSKEKPFIWSIARKEKKERNAGRTYGLLLAPWLRDLEVETEVGLSSQHLCTVKLTARKNTWVKQRRKRREEARTEKMEQAEDLDPESALISEQQEAVVVGGGSRTNPVEEGEGEVALKCELAVRWRGGEDVQVEIVPCHGGRDAAHGLLQALKNRHKAKEKNEHPEG